ncbi:hypothetical protein [Rheinheimera sp. MMS21-TC3]|uniref:hypothetical protein n=1 Tax=Rheinheimera sp. MMS21-TC3 TaxID=3072790 RepID=UPI0028C40CBF|nr:hypothetical protein [Rheinheimera sp. MMS21-TC3]WNO59402.1 hypothetical protein RDV63_00090 [Rheinheimera sp. MMS21-TC3]
MGLWNARLAATGVLDTQEVVESGILWGEFGTTLATATVYDTYATDVFTPDATGGDPEVNPAAVGTVLDGALYNEMYYVVTNTSPADIMNFNYKVNTHYTLDFDDANLLDHCEANKLTHNIGVNGAVLKYLIPLMQKVTSFVLLTSIAKLLK